MQTRFNRRLLYRGGAAMTIALGTFLIPSACGTTGSPNSVVTGFNVAMTDQEIKLDIVFSNQYQLNMDAMIPIVNNFTGVRYGEVDLLTNANGQGFTLSLAIDRTQLPQFGQLVQFEKTQKLPNGQPMSSYIDAPLYRLTFHPSPDIEVSAYVGPTLQDCYLGASVGFSFMDQNFPSQLVLTQLISDSQNRLVAAATLFGPNIQAGVVKAHGGVFIASNINKLIEYYGPQGNVPATPTTPATSAKIAAINAEASSIQTATFTQNITLQPTSKLEIQGPNASFYQKDPQQLLPLMSQFNKNSEKAYPKASPPVQIRGEEPVSQN